jgi:hypothetical protein
MTKIARWQVLLLILAATPLTAATDTAPPAAPQKSPADAHESLAAKLLDFIGIPADSGALRGLDDGSKSGEVWLVDIASGKSQQLTRTAGFRSPIFCGGTAVLALRGGDVVRVSGAADAPRKLAVVKAATKLLGCSASDPDKVLLLTTAPTGGDQLSVLSLRTSQLSFLPFDPLSPKDGELMGYLHGSDRAYAAGALYVQRHDQESSAGVVGWQDVFFQSGSSDSANVSRCDASDCGQPSLSPDMRRVVFIKDNHR